MNSPDSILAPSGDKRGRFIVLEGIEGAGKSSGISLIQELVEARGHRTILSREPGGSELGERIRDLLLHYQDDPAEPMTELLLLFAARAQHLAKRILPALSDGAWVICDRFTDSSYAYQGAGRGLGTEAVAVLENLVQQELRPDLCLVFQVSAWQARSRARSRDTQEESRKLPLSKIRKSGSANRDLFEDVEQDRIGSEGLDFMERAQQCLIHRAESEPQRYRIVPAQGDMASVHEHLRRLLSQWLDEHA